MFRVSVLADPSLLVTERTQKASDDGLICVFELMHLPKLSSLKTKTLRTFKKKIYTYALQFTHKK